VIFVVEKKSEMNLKQYWPFWGTYFCIHIMVGMLASAAGMVVMFATGQVLNGLALIGAGSFAIINGWQGYRDLTGQKEHMRYRIFDQSNR